MFTPSLFILILKKEKQMSVTVKELSHYLSELGYQDFEVVVGSESLDLASIRCIQGRKIDLKENYKTKEDIEIDEDKAYEEGFIKGFKEGRES